MSKLAARHWPFDASTCAGPGGVDPGLKTIEKVWTTRLRISALWVLAGILSLLLRLVLRDGALAVLILILRRLTFTLWLALTSSLPLTWLLALLTLLILLTLLLAFLTLLALLPLSLLPLLALLALLPLLALLTVLTLLSLLLAPLSLTLLV